MDNVAHYLFNLLIRKGFLVIPQNKADGVGFFAGSNFVSLVIIKKNYVFQ